MNYTTMPVNWQGDDVWLSSKLSFSKVNSQGSIHSLEQGPKFGHCFNVSVFVYFITWCIVFSVCNHVFLEKKLAMLLVPLALAFKAFILALSSSLTIAFTAFLE